MRCFFKKRNYQDFPGDPVVKNLPANSRDTGLIFDLGRFPHVSGQLSLCAQTTELMHHNKKSHCSEKPTHCNESGPLYWAVTKTVQFSHSVLSRVQLFVTPRTTACQASLSITICQSLLNSCPLSQWYHPTISSSVVPFSSCPQSFPASGSFPMSQLAASGGQSAGVSASTSVLPMNMQDWFLLGLTGLISLQSKGLSRVFSNTTVQKHQFFGAQQ